MKIGSLTFLATSWVRVAVIAPRDEPRTGMTDSFQFIVRIMKVELPTPTLRSKPILPLFATIRGAAHHAEQ